MAQLLDLPLGTVKTYIHRARHQRRFRADHRVHEPDLARRAAPYLAQMAGYRAAAEGEPKAEAVWA